MESGWSINHICRCNNYWWIQTLNHLLSKPVKLGLVMSDYAKNGTNKTNDLLFQVCMYIDNGAMVCGFTHHILSANTHICCWYFSTTSLNQFFPTLIKHHKTMLNPQFPWFLHVFSWHFALKTHPLGTVFPTPRRHHGPKPASPRTPWPGPESAARRSAGGRRWGAGAGAQGLWQLLPYNIYLGKV